MPNWCGNTLTLEHEDPEMIKRAETAFADGKFLKEFVPPPQKDWTIIGALRIGAPNGTLVVPMVST